MWVVSIVDSVDAYSANVDPEEFVIGGLGCQINSFAEGLIANRWYHPDLGLHDGPVKEP